MQTAIDRQAALTALRLEVSERKQDMDARERRALKAKETERVWNESWSELCTSCWLGKNRAIPIVATTREVLKALQELAPLIERRASLVDRIQKMATDQRHFLTESESLAKALDIESTSQPLDLAVRITRALEDARVAVAAREAASLRLKSAETRKKVLAEEREIHERRKTEMIDCFKVDSLQEVDAKLRDLEKRQDLQNQAAAAEQDILRALGAPSISLAEEILDKSDRSAVEAEIAQLKGRSEDQDKRSRELFSEQSKASDRLEAIDGDDAVAKIEAHRRTTLLEIEEGARRHLCLGLGISAAEQALRIYRDQHRSSMMPAPLKPSKSSAAMHIRD